MPVYTLNNLYSSSDFNGLTDLQTGTFVLSALATPDSISILDDDDQLEDTTNSPPQTLDGSQQQLNTAYDGFGAGTSVQSRATGEVTVTEPDGTTYTLEMNQVVIGGTKYFSFQYDVPPGSSISIKSWQSVGNTPYTDLSAGDPIVSNEYNQVISDTLAQSIIGGGATVNQSDLSSMFVNDQDAQIEDNTNDVVSGQTRDENIQNLAQAFSGHSAGAYVYSRQYYDVQNTVTGETARMYQIRVDDNYSGVGIPAANGTYWAFSNDFKITDGSNIVVTAGPIGLGNVDHIDLYVCFAKGVHIKTLRGDVPVEALKAGDLVLTVDTGYQPINWIGSARISAANLARNPDLRPIMIKAGALGQNLPERDLLVSPQHRVLIRSKIARRMFEKDEVLVAAKHLIGIEGISLADHLDEVTYYHFLLQRHELVYSNGAISESLFTGPVALKSVGEEARREILGLFPELNDIDYRAIPARTLLCGREGRSLTERHKKNQKPLLQSL